MSGKLCDSAAIGLLALALAGLPPVDPTFSPAHAQSRPPGGMPPGGMPPGGRMKPQMPKPPKPLPIKVIDEIVEKQHRRADIDRDGYLTIVELREQLDALAQEAITSRFEEIDSNGDASIDISEFSAWQRGMGSQVFSDSAAARVDKSIVPDSLPFDFGNGRRSQFLRLLVQPLNATIIATSDRNYDGKVSVEELQTFQRQRFNALDTNSDGFLAFNEMPERPMGAPGQRPILPPGGAVPENAPTEDTVENGDSE